MSQPIKNKAHQKKLETKYYFLGCSLWGLGQNSHKYYQDKGAQDNNTRGWN